MRTRITERDYLTAMRRASRELEIELHGKQVSMRKTRTHKSKKVYDRRAYKAITIND